MQLDDAAYARYSQTSQDISGLYSAVERHAFAVAASLGLDDAAQAATDIASRVIEKLPLFRRDALFSTWVHRIALNYCADELRRKQRAESEVPINTAAQLLPATDELELRLELEQAMERLDPLDQLIMFWKLQGETEAEVARRLGMGRRTVRLHIHDARKILEGG